jgi:GAF domain-containing protein
MQAVMALGGDADFTDDQLLWTRVAAILEQYFDFTSVAIYVREEQNDFSRRTLLGMHFGVTSRLDRSQLTPLISAALNAEAVTLIDRGMSAYHRSLITAPARKSAALPLQLGSRLLGVIEATSDISASFRRNDAQMLTVLAEQSARWFAAVQAAQTLTRQLSEAQGALTRLSEQIRIRENQALRALQTEWDSYLKRRGSVVGYDMDSAAERIIRADDLPADLRAAMERGQAVVETRGEQQVLSVPIIVRGTLLGAMAFTMPIGRMLTERQIELTRSVAERLGAALETTRLFEQSRLLAERERLANETAARLQGILDVQTLIDLAAEDFRTVLGAVYTQVVVNPERMPQQPIEEVS